MSEQKGGCCGMRIGFVLTLVAIFFALGILPRFLKPSASSRDQPREERPAFVGPPKPPTPAEKKAKEKAEARRLAQEKEEKAQQTKREGLIQKLLNERVFFKVVYSGEFAYVYTGPLFDATDIDMKNQFLSVVSAYATKRDPAAARFAAVMGTGGASVYVKDGRTGKEIGEYSPLGGFKMK